LGHGWDIPWHVCLEQGCDIPGTPVWDMAEHQLLRLDPLERRREPVVPDERHPLDERLVAAHRPVEPPEMVVPKASCGASG